MYAKMDKIMTKIRGIRAKTRSKKAGFWGVKREKIFPEDRNDT